MKTFLLLLSLVPCLAFSENHSESYMKKQPRKFLQALQNRKTSNLRADTPILRDSMYTYRGTEGTLIEKAYFTYDQQGRLTEEVALWDYNRTGNWLNIKTTFKYSATGQSAESNYYVLKDGKWELMTQNLFTYSDAETSIPQSDTEYGFFDGLRVTTFTTTATRFDAAGIPTEYLSCILKDDYPFLMKWEVTFNENNLPTSMTTFELNENNTWKFYEKIIMTYDDQGLLKMKEAHSDYNNGNWEPYYDILFEYDERGNLISEKEVEANGTIYDPLRYQNFYADDLITKNESVSVPSPITIHNNPGSLSIDLENETDGTVVMVDSTGRVVLNRPLSSRSTVIPVQSLPEGVYFIHVKTSGYQLTEKTVIR